MNVDVGHRADFFCRFWEPPRTGKVLPKFLTYTKGFRFSFVQPQSQGSAFTPPHGGPSLQGVPSPTGAPSPTYHGYFPRGPA